MLGGLRGGPSDTSPASRTLTSQETALLVNSIFSKVFLVNPRPPRRGTHLLTKAPTTRPWSTDLVASPRAGHKALHPSLRGAEMQPVKGAVVGRCWRQHRRPRSSVCIVCGHPEQQHAIKTLSCPLPRLLPDSSSLAGLDVAHTEREWRPLALTPSRAQQTFREEGGGSLSQAVSSTVPGTVCWAQGWLHRTGPARWQKHLLCLLVAPSGYPWPSTGTAGCGERDVAKGGGRRAQSSALVPGSCMLLTATDC